MPVAFSLEKIISISKASSSRGVPPLIKHRKACSPESRTRDGPAGVGRLYSLDRLQYTSSQDAPRNLPIKKY